MKIKKYFLTIVILFIQIIFSGSAMSQVFGKSDVRIWEEPLVIPTYLVGKADLNPIFYTGRAYQGAKGKVYPYPFLDKLTDNRKNKTYNAVYLENKYLKICVLPEIGGRIFSAVDKTNNYDFFYHQHVIKPALVGMLGAWISGGVEWNVPHHHRATTFMPVDYTLQNNSDGSKTIWVGEIELRHRMKWIVGLTLYPDKSYIEVTGKLFNRTPFVNSFLFWANTAVHADSTYQIIFPPSTEYATYHGKNQFTEWPVSHQIYNGVDYTRGVDLSWWKNHPSPKSFFAWNYKDNFFAGYNHGKDAGVALVANHHIVPGKKLWEWGPGPKGKMWDKILTDTDGPYIELMVGAYSDNQPDYSWCQPYETKTFKMFWYPIKKINGVKNANINAAVNLDITSNNNVLIGFNTTSEFKNARVILKTNRGNLFEQIIDISPEKPFLKKIHLPENIKKDELTVILLSSKNEEIISYKPVRKKNKPMPEPVNPPPEPEKIKTTEELYLTGLRLEQFYNPAIDPIPYYQEALKRDPDDYRTNTQLGILYCKKGLFVKAVKKLNLAVRRITKNYTSPKNGEAFYYLGIALKHLNKYEEAYDVFYKAIWSYAWRSAGYYQLAELDCKKKNFKDALNHINLSISANTLNIKALNLKTTILRKFERYKEAEKLALETLSIDPLNFYAENELYLIKSITGNKKEAQKGINILKVKMRNNPQNYLELATDYSNINLWDDAIEILLRLTTCKKEKASSYPMLYYYLGYLYNNKGDKDKALKYFREANRMPADYCFPFRLESIDVLQSAINNNPDDAKVHYYLGNLLYENQPEKAIEEWEKSKNLDSTFSIVYRNLGFAYSRIKNDIPEAITCMEKAIKCNPCDPRYYYELDILYEMEGVPLEKRLELLEKNHKIVQERDYSLTREIILYVQSGYYDRAINILKNHHFHVWEGGGKIHNVYVDAHLLRGKKRFKSRKFKHVLEDYKAALEYPENLEVGKPYYGGREPQIYYLIGTVYEAMGNIGKAKVCYEKSIKKRYGLSEMKYYQGLALKKLGQNEKANNIFDGLIKYGKERLKRASSMDFFAKFGEKQSIQFQLANAHYLTGLGCLGKGKKEKAKTEFKETIKLNPNHLWAKIRLSGF